MLSRLNRAGVIERKWWIAAAIYIVCAAAFVRDINDVEEIPYGIFYLPMVGTAVFYRNARAVWWLATIASLMVAIGYFLPAISATPLETAVNRLGSVVAIFVTAGLLRHARASQEALARQTLRAERGDQAKARLLTNLSRELVTPLNSIVGFSEMLREACRDDQREYLGYILEGGRGLLATFRNLIDATAGERRHLRPAPVDLAPLVQKALRGAAVEAARQRVTLELAPPDDLLPAARADAWAARRIVENLIENAVKFSIPDGTVAVAVLQRGNEVAVRVRDDGIGMTPEVVARLGELFFQADSGGGRRFEGMGAGLALSLQLAAAMGGRVQFESAPGRGTTATLFLPAAPPIGGTGSAFDSLRVGGYVP